MDPYDEHEAKEATRASSQCPRTFADFWVSIEGDFAGFERVSISAMRTVANMAWTTSAIAELEKQLNKSQRIKGGSDEV